MVYLDRGRELFSEVIVSSSSLSRGPSPQAGSEHLPQALQAPQARSSTPRLYFRRLSPLERRPERRTPPGHLRRGALPACNRYVWLRAL